MIDANQNHNLALSERVRDVQNVWQGNIFDVELLQVELPDGTSAQREIVRHRGGVGIVVLDAHKRVCLVRQWRVAFNDYMLEIPAGKLEQGEDALSAAYRELREETGLVAARLDHLFDLAGSPGFTNELTRIYLVQDFVQDSPQPDEEEFVELFWFDLDELVEMIFRAEISDSKTAAAILAIYAQQIKTGQAQK